MLAKSGAGPIGRHLLHYEDLSGLTVSAGRAVALQVDGDFVGTVREARFLAVPHAVRVLGPRPERPTTAPTVTQHTA